MEKKTNGKAVGSLVCGIVGLFFAGIILGIISIVLGNKAQDQIKERQDEQGIGLAKAGKILGWIDIIGGIMSVIILLV